MVTAISQDGSAKKVIFESNIVALDKSDILVFDIDTEGLKYKIMFVFSNEGRPFSTTYFEDIENSSIRYVLHNWDSATWVEISEPFKINVKNSNESFWMKFRDSSPTGSNNRVFSLTIWKTILK